LFCAMVESHYRRAWCLSGGGGIDREVAEELIKHESPLSFVGPPFFCWSSYLLLVLLLLFKNIKIFAVHGGPGRFA